MNPKVRSTLEDDVAQDQACSICGQASLHVVHLAAYPDYVNCDNCGSAFVVEDGGERVMYGKIPAQYPETRHFALQQWVWPEAIARKAAPERPSGGAPVPSILTPPSIPATEPPEPEPPAAVETPVDTGPAELPAEEEPAVEDAFAKSPMEDEPIPDKGEAELHPSEVIPTSQPEIPTWPPPPVDGQADMPELEPADSFADEVTAAMDSETMDSEAPAPSEAFGLAEEPPAAEETGEEPTPAAFHWESEQPAVGAPADEPQAAEAEPTIGDEEDLLDSLWGDEPYPASEVQTSRLPEPPAWATDISPESEEPSPPESEDQPPAETDMDTASRLHTWGAPQSEPAGLHAPGEAVEGHLSEGEGETVFPTPADDFPPAIAPFEAGDWADDSFGFPEEPESSSTPTEQEAPEGPSAEPAPEEMAPPDRETGDDGDQPADASGEPAVEDAAKTGMAKAYWGGKEGPPPKEEPLAEILPEAESEHHEPPPGNRYRVVVKGSSARYPENICSHCLYSPAPARLPILASLTRSGVGDRQIGTLRVPVCADCKTRADARSEEQRTAQLQAHLIGVLVALILIVCGLGFSLINLKENLVPALIGLLVLAGLGYVVPAVPLLLRASRMPKPPDSDYVSTTLRVPGDTEGTETAFEWRNQDYARRFLQANIKIAVSEVTRVREEEA
jgi:hypothetical protein